MPEFRFNPPVKLKRDVVVTTLDDAASFLRRHKHPKLLRTRDSVLRLVERARNKEQRSIALGLYQRDRDLERPFESANANGAAHAPGTKSCLGTLSLQTTTEPLDPKDRKDKATVRSF